LGREVLIRDRSYLFTLRVLLLSSSRADHPMWLRVRVVCACVCLCAMRVCACALCVCARQVYVCACECAPVDPEVKGTVPIFIRTSIGNVHTQIYVRANIHIYMNIYVQICIYNIPHIS